LDNESRYENVTKSVETSPEGKVAMLWDQVQTDRTLPNHKPDVIISGNEIGTSLLRDIEVAGARNVIKKEAEKVLKYKDHKYKHSTREYKNNSDTIIGGANRINSNFF
jgi:hypothetical protein